MKYSILAVIRKKTEKTQDTFSFYSHFSDVLLQDLLVNNQEFNFFCNLSWLKGYFPSCFSLLCFHRHRKNCSQSATKCPKKTQTKVRILLHFSNPEVSTQEQKTKICLYKIKIGPCGFTWATYNSACHKCIFSNSFAPRVHSWSAVVSFYSDFSLCLLLHH